MNYFDLHCDTATKINNNCKDLAVFKTNCFENYCQVFSLFIPEIDRTPVLTYKKLLNIAKFKLNAKYLSLENASLLGKDLSAKQLKSDGISSVMLTWNSKNQFASGANSNGGLTEKGKNLITELNKLNIALDVSHLNEKSFSKAVEYSNIVFASHSNCKAVINNNRNLSDTQIKTIINKKGIIGLNFYPKFLGEDIFKGVYLNIVHILKLGGENCISIGSDFDGAVMNNELNNVEKIPKLYNYLQNKGLHYKLLNKVFWQNAENFYNSFDK